MTFDPQLGYFHFYETLPKVHGSETKSVIGHQKWFETMRKNIFLTVLALHLAKVKVFMHFAEHYFLPHPHTLIITKFCTQVTNDTRLDF